MPQKNLYLSIILKQEVEKWANQSGIKSNDYLNNTAQFKIKYKKLIEKLRTKALKIEKQALKKKSFQKFEFNNNTISYYLDLFFKIR